MSSDDVWMVTTRSSNEMSKQYNCDFCNQLVSMHSLNEHIKSNCNVEWVEQSINGQNGSLGLPSK